MAQPLLCFLRGSSFQSNLVASDSEKVRRVFPPASTECLAELFAVRRDKRRNDRLKDRVRAPALVEKFLKSIPFFWLCRSPSSLEIEGSELQASCKMVNPKCHRHLSLKVQNIEFNFDVKLLKLMYPYSTIHQNFTSNTHLYSIIGPWIWLWCICWQHTVASR